METFTILGFVYGANGPLARFVLHELLQARRATTQSCKEMLELLEAMAHLQQIEMYVDKYAVEPLEPLLVSGRKRLFTDIELKQATGTHHRQASKRLFTGAAGGARPAGSSAARKRALPVRASSWPPSSGPSRHP